MKCALYALLFSAAVAAAADKSALGDRLVLDLPESAQVGQRTTALMAAFPGDDESLFWVGDGADRIAVYVKALDMLADEDFEKQARAIIERYKEDGAEFEVKTLNPDIIYGLRKSAPRKASGADMYGVAFIRHKDGSMIRLQILFADKYAETPEKNCEWSENVIRSIRFGSGVRPSAARVDTINLFDEAVMELPVPEGYVRTINPGHDFTYTTFTKLTRQDDPPEYFGVYLGMNPNFKEEKFENAQKVQNTVAGKKATWYCTESDVYRADALLLLSGCDSELWWRLSGLIGSTPEPPLYSHIIIIAPSAEKRTEIINNFTQAKLIEHTHEDNRPAVTPQE